LTDTEAKERIDYLLDFTGLRERADDGYQMYSTGMQRRLLLCRALVRDTSIIVFDEPTSGLDPTGAAEFRDLLIDRLARREGKTILLSTHNLQEAQELCDRIAILDRGRVIACDTPDNVRHLVTERRTLRVAFSGVAFGEDQHRLLFEMGEVAGVHGVSPVLGQEGTLVGLSIEIEKDVDFTRVLDLMAGSGLNIKSVNTEEPSLEDAFIAMTRREATGRGQTRIEGEA
jgi:ABC-2 type transport system ATP-binding protein